MWSNVAAHVMADAPALGAALDSLAADAPTDVLALAGTPGASCWGTGGARPALFLALSDAHVEMLVEALQVQGLAAGLKTLEVRSQAGVGDRGALAIAQGLLADPACGLEHLDLTGCEVGGAGVASLCSAVTSNPASCLKSLRLGWNPLGREGGLAVAQLMGSNRTIETLGLCNTSLDTMATVCLYAALRENPVVVDVDLQKALLYSKHEDTTKHAAQLLCINSSIQSLNLANCTVGDVGASVVAKALFRNTCLKSLNLSNNQIGVAGAEALAEVLGSGGSCAVARLDLSSNRFGEAGGVALGKALATNTGLRSLNLGSSRLGPTALLAVAQGMAINSTLRFLGLWGNDFPPEGEPVAGAAKRGSASSGCSGCVGALDALLKGRWRHLDVETDVATYELDGFLLVARC